MIDGILVWVLHNPEFVVSLNKEREDLRFIQGLDDHGEEALH